MKAKIGSKPKSDKEIKARLAYEELSPEKLDCSGFCAKSACHMSPFEKRGCLKR